MSLHNLVANGGKILIVGGMPKNWQEYRNHPQLEFWSGEAAEIESIVKTRAQNGIPTNVKAVIVSRFIPHSVQDKLLPEARKKGITYFPQQTDGDISKLLDEVTKDIPKGEPKKIAQRGSIKAIIQELDNTDLIPADSAREIFKVAGQRGIKTTFNSVVQGVRHYRKQHRLGTRPPSVAKPKSSIQTLINAFDDAIAGLQLAREAAEQISKENDELKAYKAKIEKMLEGMKQ